MKVTIEILQGCGQWVAGDRDRIDARRAAGLVQTGYARIVDEPGLERAVAPAPEQAIERRRKERR